MSEQQSALIHVMVLASAADSNMTDRELATIGDIVRHLPIFRGFDPENILSVAEQCVEWLGEANGLEKALQSIETALPERLRETAYAVACDVVAADGQASQEELRLLEMLRYRLAVGRLPAAAIERGARARYQQL